MFKIIFFIIFTNFAWAKTEPIKVRVRIAKSLSKIKVSGTDLINVFHSNNRETSYGGKKTIQFNCETARNSNSPVLFSSLSSKTGLIDFEDQKYQGEMLIISKGKSGSCDVVNETSMESYISSLLAKEMNAVWPIELALKAQAVAARTYAYQKMKSKYVSKTVGFETYYDLESSERHQVGGQFFDANQNTVRAANLTKGEILLTKSGEVTPIFFHAKCGGRTLRPDQVWENVVSGYDSVRCPFCEDHGQKGWKSTLTTDRFKKFINFLQKGGHISKIVSKNNKLFIPFNDSNKAQVRIYLGENFYTFNKSLFRNYFGRVIVPSNYFKIIQDGYKIELIGAGLGHGVGMCQLGTLDMAQERDMIIKLYWPIIFPTIN